MQITVTVAETDGVVMVDLDPNDSVDTLKAVLEAETGLAAEQQRLLHNGRDVASGQTLGAAGIQANDLLMLLRRVPAGAARPAQQGAAAQPAAAQQAGNPVAMNHDGSAVNPELLMQFLESQPGQLEQLPPDLQAAVRSKNVAGMQDALRKMTEEKRKAAEEERRFMELAESDPFNPEVQRRLMEVIEQRNVHENMELALEHNPEAFSSVCMLYVNMEVAGFPLKAFIDSGAQMTIMSRSCAERCNLLRLMDRRWAGTAVGVGSAKILGRIHMVQLKAGASYFPFSITVLDQDGMEFLFGLDNLKRHQCCIDLKDNVLRFGSSGEALPFLPEHEIPKSEHKLAGGDLQSPSQSGPSAAAPAPAAQQPAASGGGAPAAAGGLPAGWEEKLERLQGLGFPRDACLQALRATNGNEEMAGSLLFGG
ncbi:DNA damage-inducible 1 [Chlorella sorokiniana]|uniref:DNA damage-inducible 1 n=1 Tax=Chlorella sorokiniana TaxID=3076 RepID=A0A2P6TVS1_CHLSO|nr:DNA damage-inducible 1 [Chlorella sorokiniana]|eukprot:PRW58158.1 DNA damage-inducible 1 [Chlorella sorokiniana]